MQAQGAGVEIVEHGLYTGDVERKEPGPQGIGTDVVVNICHVMTTTTIPASYGVQFGFRFRVAGPPGEIVDLTKTVQFPVAIKPQGAAQAIAIYKHEFEQETGVVSYTGFGFDHDWELVPGPWTMQIWQGRQKLAEIVFNVVDGVEAPAPRTSNANCFRISSL